MVAVQALFVYPIKGCQGIPLKSAAVTLTGLPYDRQWMVVREATGKFVTQRQIPKLCKVSVSLPPEALLCQSWGELQPGAAMVLSAPGMPQLQVPLTDPSASTANNTRSVTVWEWSGTAVDEGDEAAAWFSKYLDTPVRLVRHIGRSATAAPVSGPTVRPVDPEFAPGHEVKFADGFPLLVAREENLADLNARLASAGEAALPMNRFRPNIVLAGGGAAWSDDGWQGLNIGSSSGGAGGEGTVLQYVKPCSRCKVTTINQETAEEGREPLTTLGSFRSGKLLGLAEQRRSWTHDVFFGWNAAVVSPGQVAVGDTVTPAVKA